MAAPHLPQYESPLSRYWLETTLGCNSRAPLSQQRLNALEVIYGYNGLMGVRGADYLARWLVKHFVTGSICSVPGYHSGVNRIS